MEQAAQAYKLLDALIKMPTVNGSEGSVATYLKVFFEQNGIAVRLIPWDNNYNRVNLIADLHQSDGPTLGLSGHEDVVAPIAADAWEYGPFLPAHHHGKIYGRGTSDMKSGLAAMVLAMVRLKHDPDFRGNLRFIATVGEENGRLGSQQLAKMGVIEDLAGLIVGEPSNASSEQRLEQLLAQGRFQVPATNPPKFGRHAFFFAHRGTLDYQVVAQGKAAHSAIPELGVNALDNLITFYNRQQEYFQTLLRVVNPVLGRTNTAVTMLQAGEQPNTIPNLAHLTAKLRTIPEYPNERIITDLQQIIADLNAEQPARNLSLTVKNNNLPVVTPLGHPLVKITQRCLARIWHEPSLALGAPGGTDASEFLTVKPDLPVVIVGPGNESAHAIDEFVREDDYLQTIDLYQEIIKEYFAQIVG